MRDEEKKGTSGEHEHAPTDAGATAGTVTCTAQMALYYYGANIITAGNTRSLSLAANGAWDITFPSLLRVGQPYATVDIICSVPAGFKLGLLQNVETD